MLKTNWFGKELSIKDVRGRGLTSANISQTRGMGFFRCERPHFLVQKT